MGLQRRDGVWGGFGIQDRQVFFSFRSDRFGMRAVLLDTSQSVWTPGHAAVGQKLSDPAAEASLVPSCD